VVTTMKNGNREQAGQLIDGDFTTTSSKLTLKILAWKESSA